MFLTQSSHLFTYEQYFPVLTMPTERAVAVQYGICVHVGCVDTASSHLNTTWFSGRL